MGHMTQAGTCNGGVLERFTVFEKYEIWAYKPRRKTLEHHPLFLCLLPQQLGCQKEYYEIVGESRPLSAFFPTHADLFTEMHFYS